jgi:hypothetical protein
MLHSGIKDILHIEKKGPLINTLEGFHIRNLSKEKLQMNDTYTDIHNPIFNLTKDHSSNKSIQEPPSPATHPNATPLPLHRQPQHTQQH